MAGTDKKRGFSASELTAGRMYDLNGPGMVKRDWFGLIDCFTRLVTAIGLYYYNLLSCPLRFTYYVPYWMAQWHGWLYGLISFLFIPIFPLLIMVWALWKRVKAKIVPRDDWMMKGPGRIFFLSPPGRLATWLWDSYLDLSQLVGVFLMCNRGCTLEQLKEAARTAVVDTPKTDKTFWRRLMSDTDVRVPLELGVFKEGRMRWNSDVDVDERDVVAKIADSYLGIGDKFLEFGKDFKTKADLEKIAVKCKEWEGRTVLLLEWVRPLQETGVHSFDVVTVSTANGPRVVSMLYWGECTGPTSHTARGGYVVDVESETISGKASFYSPYFAIQEGKLVGTKLPGVKKIAEMAVRAHGAIKYPWMRMVGWDAMFLRRRRGRPTGKTPEVVFFEGNFAASRIHRRITLAPKNAGAFIREYA